MPELVNFDYDVQITRTIRYEVTGDVEPHAAHGMSGNPHVPHFYPRHVTIVYQMINGDVESVRVSMRGPRVLKGGVEGKAEHGDRYVSERDWPEWLRQVIGAHTPTADGWGFYVPPAQ